MKQGISNFHKNILNYSVWVLIAVNVLMFVAVHVLNWCGVSVQAIATTLPLPASVEDWIYRPWTLLTYMFLQWDFMHLTFNMLWLWCFGMLATRMLVRGGVIVAAYLAGGIAAAVSFLIVGLFIGADGGIMLGSSASVLGVIGAVGVLRGRQTVSMMLIGNVQTRWLAAGVIALVLITSGADHGWPELCAHAVGALAGVVTGFVAMRQRSRQSDTNIKKFKPQPFSKRGAEYGAGSRQGLAPTEQAELDALLEIVHRGGYNALTINQRIRLYDLSAKIR